MGVNTEMHDCEPAMTRPQHLNMSYSLSRTIHGQITRHFGLLELSVPSPPSAQLFNKCTMDDTRTSDNERTDILITSPFFICLPLHLLIAVVNHSLTSLHPAPIHTTRLVL